MQEFVAFSHTLADTSGAILRRYFRRPMQTETKADLSPVTAADREVEAALRALIEKTYPQHGFVGEESGTLREEVEYIWVIDPIDGTMNFITGKPIFGTLIALIHKGKPILGIIDNPITHERWVGAVGATTLMSPRMYCGVSLDLQEMPQHVRHDRGLLNDCILSTTSPYLFADEKKEAFERLRAAVKYTTFGSDCYAYALLAGGHLGLVVESGLKAYDVMALIPIIEGAGGVITDWRGQPIPFTSGAVDVLAAANNTLHAEALAILRRA